MNWYIWIVYNRIILYQFVFANAEEWLYKLFMHQACVFENKYQYDMSNKILTNVISVAFTKGHIELSLKEAIEAFQIKLNNKRKYLAFYIRKSIHNCYDTMTTSPCESMNRHIKHTSNKATTLNNTRWVKLSLYDYVRTILLLMFCIYFFVYIILYVLFRCLCFVCTISSIFFRLWIHLYPSSVACIKQLVVHCYWLQMVQMIAYLQLTTLLYESCNFQL